jgi:ubiquinone/menaquinone biosynthesis C-methylase UbiE
MDLQYYVTNEIFRTLHFAPFDEKKPPTRVLDVGTGTGIWCIQMGDMYPSADILGIDISPIQPREVPLNVRFMVDDA